MTVNLYDGSNSLVGTTTTDSSGLYLFTSLVPGDYSVGFVPPSGYVVTGRDQGADDAADSDADTSTGRTAVTNLSPGETDLTLDAGLHQGVLCVRSDGLFLWELFGADFDTTPGTAHFDWQLTNNSTSPLSRADFRFIPGATVTSPVENDTYDSGNHTYTVDVVTGNHAGVAFIPSDGDAILGGESDSFRFDVDTALLTMDTVLWNNATTAGNDTGRIDIRSELCYVEPNLEILEPAACYDERSEGRWEVKVSWQARRETTAESFQVYRIDPAQSEPVLVGTVSSADANGRVQVLDSVPAGGASGYRIQALQRGGVPMGDAAEVQLEICPALVGPSDGTQHLALVLAILACAALVARRLRLTGARSSSTDQRQE